MYLSQINIEGFRGVAHASLALDPGLNLLVGPNNVGKSTILDAVRLAVGWTGTEDGVRVSDDDWPWQVSPEQRKPIYVGLVFDGLSDADQVGVLEACIPDPAAPERMRAHLHCEVAWDATRGRPVVRRWGGARAAAESRAADAVLQHLHVVYLGPLRDANTGLTPRRNGRVGRLLRALATDDDKSGISDVFKAANKALETQPLVSRTQERIAEGLRGASGPILAQEIKLRTADANFDQLVNTLRLVFAPPSGGASGSAAFMDLVLNGLGYNNLIYIVTVLSELDAAREREYPILLLEEPEAHLHPQLQVLLATFLERAKFPPGHPPIQSVVSTHSPVIASHAPFSVRLVHRAPNGSCRAPTIRECGLDDAERDAFQRMLDVTRAAMLFASGAIVVEGVSEALLLPVFAERLGTSLEEHGVAVIMACGVGFDLIAQICAPDRFEIPMAIVTDGDPAPVDDAGREGWEASPESARPTMVGPRTKLATRVTALKARFAKNPFVGVFHSDVTLEYDLAAAGHNNADVIAEAWESLFDSSPRHLTRALVAECTDARAKALLVWRALCLRRSARGKADLAQRLAGLLKPTTARAVAGGVTKPKAPIRRPKFEIPEYIRLAIEHVTPKGHPANDASRSHR